MNYLQTILLCLLLLPVFAFAKVHLLAMNANTEGLKYTGNDRIRMVNAFRRRYGKELKVYEIPNVSLAKFQNKIQQIKVNLQDGDEVVVYFSGHGSTVLDRNKDENDPWDELLVFAQKQRLVDDDFAEYLKPFFNYQLTVILDSCNSGDMSKTTKKSDLIAKYIPTLTPSNAGLFEKESMVSMLDHAQFKGTLIAAAKESQQAYEDQNKKGGLFTYYFTQAFADKRNTLAKSFSIAKNNVINDTREKAKEQSPVMENH